MGFHDLVGCPLKQKRLGHQVGLLNKDFRNHNFYSDLMYKLLALIIFQRSSLK